VPQKRALERVGHEVVEVDLGADNSTTIRPEYARDHCDAVVFSKAKMVKPEDIQAVSKVVPTVYWFMDGLEVWNRRYRHRAEACTYVVAHAEGVAKKAGAFHIFEGFDPEVDNPQGLPKDTDCTFLGSLKRGRRFYTDAYPMNVIKKSTREEHAEWVSRSIININLTDPAIGGFSDRVFKVMSAGGFLLSSDTPEIRRVFLEPGTYLDTFSSPEEMKEKIEYYLKNPFKARAIANRGYQFVRSAFSLDVWAQKMTKLLEK